MFGQRAYYTALAQKVQKKLLQRNFNAIICDSLETAREEALNRISPHETVAFGGSVTVTQSGLIDALYKRQQPIINRELATTPAERYQLMRQSLLSDVYLTSINGLTDSGVLVNVDSVGNRVAAITYGPEKVFAFVGMNKVYGDLDTTVSVVRNRTAPKNSFRLGLDSTPCIKNGSCGNCLKEECICSIISVIRRSKLPDRITLFLIMEEAGL